MPHLPDSTRPVFEQCVRYIPQHKLLAHLTCLEKIAYRNNISGTIHYFGRAGATIQAGKRAEIQRVVKQLLTAEMFQKYEESHTSTLTPAEI